MFWLLWQNVRKKRLTSWILRSVCPFVCGWYPDVRLTVTFRSEKKARQTLEMNCGPLSDTISSGIPKFRNTCSKSNSAVLKAVGRPLRGISLQALENLSMVTRIHVFPSEGGRSVTKSTPRCDQGCCGMGSGNSFPEGKCRGTLVMAQSWQPWINSLTSWCIPGHQYFCWIDAHVLVAPGWPVPTEE